MAAKYLSKEPCIVCGEHQENKVCYHHIKTRKAYPELAGNPDNWMSLCLTHHSLIHSMGTTSFVSKFQLAKYMIHKGWEYDSFADKWILPFDK